MKRLTKYLKNRETSISLLLKRPKRDFTPGTFHKLRVEIKKLNALFDLINFCSEDFKRKETFKPFKKIFHQAGKVRELQLEEAMLKRYLRNNSHSSYKNSLKKLRLNEQHTFFSIVNKKLMDRLEKKYHASVTFLLCANNKKANDYMEKKRNTIKKLICQPPLQPQHLHELRKRLKMLNYIKKCLALEQQNKTLSKNDVLPALLGKWHDCRIIIRHLNKTMENGGINPRELRLLEKTKEKISLESEKLFGKINRALHSSEFYQGY